MRQLNLPFTSIPIPQTQLWEQFDDNHKQAVIELLARLMSQAAKTIPPQEKTND